MRFDELRRLPVLLPTINEQCYISNFLERETSRIDKLIEKKEKHIELLKEKRAALISHAVTKGLDPNVTMKDSGIEWLGEIPEHWEPLSLKYLIDVRDGTHDTPGYVEPDEYSFPLLTSKDINNGDIFLEDAKHISKKDYDAINIRSKVAIGDIIMPMIGTIGNPAKVFRNSDFAIKNVALFRTSKGGLDPDYLKFFLTSSPCKNQIDLYTSGGVQNFVGLGTLRNLIVFKMSTGEDKLISFFLNQQTKQIDILQEKVQKSIELLKEYRTAIISAAVTGKIDVRGIV